jgi:hypothetical protein
MDEALMIMYVPRKWQDLEEAGITGAIDLADLYFTYLNQDDAQLEPLANQIGLTPPLLRALLQRVHLDHQVLYIWALYNRFLEAGSRNEVVPPAPVEHP